VRAIIEHRKSAEEIAAATRSWATSQADPSRPTRRLWEVLPDGIWRGQRCFLIGGGPSLKGFDFDRLHGERVIAINKAFYDAPFADIMFAMDRPLIDELQSGRLGANYRDAFRDFGGLKIWLDISGYVYPPDVYSLPSAGEIGWTRSLRAGLYHGQNSGYGALNLAMVLKANPIYLLGYDLKEGPAGEKHYHDGYRSGWNPDALGKFRAAFAAGAAVLPPGAPRIINLNPISMLRSFEFGDIDDVLGPADAKGKGGGFVVISFYTTGTSYSREIKGLEESLERFKLARHVFACEPTGTWRGNLNHKSESILKAFAMFPDKDIVFLDADAVVRQRPVLFEQLSARRDYDLSAHFFKYDARSGDSDELLSGTLWIQNGEAGRGLVKRWHEIGLARPDVRHQMCLKAAIEDLEKEGKRIRVYRHPFAYTCIYDYHAAKGVVPVIEHFQASRRFRREVGYGQGLLCRRPS